MDKPMALWHTVQPCIISFFVIKSVTNSKQAGTGAVLPRPVQVVGVWNLMAGPNLNNRASSLSFGHTSRHGRVARSGRVRVTSVQKLLAPTI